MQYSTVFVLVILAGAGCKPELPEKSSVDSLPPSGQTASGMTKGVEAGEHVVKQADSPVIGIWLRSEPGEKGILTVDEGNTYEYVDSARPERSHRGTYIFTGKRVSLRPKSIGDASDPEAVSGVFLNLKFTADKNLLSGTDDNWRCQFKRR